MLDFGLAKRLVPGMSGQGGPTANLVVGTVEYLAPEATQPSQLNVDERTDQWALAVLAYRMLAGRAPFAHRDPWEQCLLIQKHEPPPLARYAPALPERIQPAIERALSKEKERRFDSVLDFMRALEGLPARPARAGAGPSEPLPGEELDAENVPEYVAPDYSVQITAVPAASGPAPPSCAEPPPSPPPRRKRGGYLSWSAALGMIGATLAVQDTRPPHEQSPTSAPVSPSAQPAAASEGPSCSDPEPRRDPNAPVEAGARVLPTGRSRAQPSADPRPGPQRGRPTRPGSPPGPPPVRAQPAAPEKQEPTAPPTPPPPSAGDPAPAATAPAAPRSITLVD